MIPNPGNQVVDQLIRIVATRVGKAMLRRMKVPSFVRLIRSHSLGGTKSAEAPVHAQAPPRRDATPRKKRRSGRYVSRHRGPGNGRGVV